MQYWRYACVNTASLQYWVSTLYAQDTTCLLLLTKRQHWSIGVARIFPGGTLFSSKSWWPFYSRCPQFTQAKIATLTTLTNQSSHNQEKFPKKLTSCCAWGVHLQFTPINYPKNYFSPWGCMCTQCTPWLRLWWLKLLADNFTAIVFIPLCAYRLCHWQYEIHYLHIIMSHVMYIFPGTL